MTETRVQAVDSASSRPPVSRHQPTGAEIARQTKWLGVGQAIADCAFYGTVVLLAALVPPAAFGTVAAGMAIVRIAGIAMDAGTNGSIIAIRNLTSEQVWRAARLNVVVGAVLSVGIALAAGPIAAVFAGGGQAGVVRVLGLGVTLQALTIVPMALLRKVLDFRRYAVVNSISAVSTAVIALCAALLGAGVWALVLRQLLFPALAGMLAWRAARPLVASLPRAAGGGAPLRTGARAIPGFLVVGAATLLAMTLDNLLVGAVTDARQLAFYALGFTLGFAPLTMISWRIGQVLFPAAAATTDLHVVGRRTALAMRLMAVLLCPVVPAAIALAPSAIPAIFGPEWAPMVVPFQILVLVGVIHSIGNMIGESLSGTGNIGFRAWCDAPWAAVTLIAVAALAQVAGIRGAAAAHLLTVVPLIAAYVLLGSRRIGTKPVELWRALRGVLGPIGAQLGVTLGVLALVPGLPRLAGGATAAAAGLIALAMGLWLAPSRPLADLRSALRSTFGRPRSRASTGGERRPRVSKRGRMPGLEGLRAVAAISILLLHSWQYSDPAGAVSLGPLSPVVLNGLPLGVTLFFTLSGFLLYLPFSAAILRGKPRPAFARYLRNRALRILPAYWVILLLVALVLQSALVWDSKDGSAAAAAMHEPALLLRNLLLVQGYDPTTLLTGIGPAWSLAVEAVFYVMLPVLVLLAAGMARRATSHAGRLRAVLAPAVVLLTTGISGKLFGALVVTSGDGWDPTWHSVIERSFWGQADLFAFGLIVAVVRIEVDDGRIRLPAWWRSAAWAGIALVAFVGGLVPLGLPEYAYGTLVALGFGLLLALVVLPGPSATRPRLVRMLESRAFVATGVISYSLFLWNDPITRFLAAHHLTLPGHAGLLANIALIFALSWTAAALTYRYVERPALRWKTTRGAQRASHSTLAPERLRATP